MAEAPPRPEVWSLEELVAADLPQGHLWSLPRFAERARERLGLPSVGGLAEVPPGARALVVVGGGTRIDEAKLWRLHERPGVRLIAVPTVWGSGAEASPVVALNRDGGKRIEVDARLTPDVRVSWPGLAAGLPTWRASAACGDAWSHALEGFLSPLASPRVHERGAELIAALLELPVDAGAIGHAAEWFEASAAACALQASSGVGLVHGIAHVLEASLDGLDPARPYGHARLCALFLAPVLAFDREHSATLAGLFERHGIDGVRLAAVAGALFDPAAYARVLPFLRERWRDVLRDACTRMNGALVRPAHLAHFTGFDGEAGA